MSEAKQIKCVVIGDGNVGKTCLLIARTQNSFPKVYVPTVFDNHQLQMEMDGCPISIDLWDTAGQEDFDRLRPLSYPKTDVFLVCFSIANGDSLQNVKSKWLPEISHHAPGVPHLLIGTKLDLRDDPKTQNELKSKGTKMVSEAEGEDMAQQIQSVKYIECSAKTQENIALVFEEAVRKCMSNTKKPRKTPCIIL